jgi:hypothetical protein
VVGASQKLAHMLETTLEKRHEHRDNTADPAAAAADMLPVDDPP